VKGGMSFEGPHVGWKQDHTFDWNSMQPDGGGPPTGAIADRIKDSFGDYAGFHQAFVDAAVTQFGSGWAWLMQDQDKKLKVVKPQMPRRQWRVE
jgi:Fe-Mn family superoxide dismutase